MHHIARLFVENCLQTAARFELNAAQSHYVSKVMRVRQGDVIRCFNGHDGEWATTVEQIGRRTVTLQMDELLRPQQTCPDIELVFAPIKRSRMEFIVEKATEMGVRNMQIIRTQYSNQKSVRLDRLLKICVEAAEQTERLDVPQIAEEQTFANWLGRFPSNRTLVFCDESGENTRPALEALQARSIKAVSVLIGPEGGFSADERTQIYAMDNAVAISLGPRILRADTASVAALTLVQAISGDWTVPVEK